MGQDQIAGVQPSVNIATTLQLRYVMAAIIVGPMFGALWALVLYGVAWLLSWDTRLLDCYAIGWAISTVSFCMDHRAWFTPLELELGGPPADEPPHPPRPMRPREAN